VPRIAGAVLAAGSGSRMGTPKGVLEVGGQRLVDRAVAALRAGGCEPVIAVVQVGVEVPNAVSVVNDRPERGMRLSLRLAVLAAGDADALAVLLVDAPGIGAPAVDRVVRGWVPDRAAVATFDGRRGHPIVMAPSLWQEALAAAGADEGARRFLAAHPELVLEIPVPGDPHDLDTPADLTRWRDG
jgi:CTP:molybdopterin cytidylyltransferase MocA